MIQTTESIDFGRLITGHSPFSVPKYQRAYAWDEDEVTEYLDDMERLYRDRVNSSENRMPHFFGGLVSVRRFASGTPHGYIHDVVDGQQRLATFMITICAILEGLKIIEQKATASGDAGATDDAKIEREKTETNYFFYLEGVGRQTQKRLRLSLSKADNKYFEDLMRNIGDARTKKNL
ncbi:MAG: DUF262 domain-containing protein [Chloroflexaceae bacterium]|nr:DUF262 domain-containing protein [Chloroflexaceae bacterium]